MGLLGNVVKHQLIFHPNPLLRQVCKNVSFGENGVHLKEKLMFEDMLSIVKKEDGVGIASPQVGKLKNMFAMLRMETVETGNPMFQAVLNPKVLDSSENIYYDIEGCLSIPGVVGVVPRKKWMDVVYEDLMGVQQKERLEGFQCRIFQHEMDHLEGILYTDRCDPKSVISETKYAGFSSEHCTAHVEKFSN